MIQSFIQRKAQALILYKNNIQPAKKADYVKAYAALILYKNNIQQELWQECIKDLEALILYKNNIQLIINKFIKYSEIIER